MVNCCVVLNIISSRYVFVHFVPTHLFVHFFCCDRGLLYKPADSLSPAYILIGCLCYKYILWAYSFCFNSLGNTFNRGKPVPFDQVQIDNVLFFICFFVVKQVFLCSPGIPGLGWSPGQSSPASASRAMRLKGVCPIVLAKEMSFFHFCSLSLLFCEWALWTGQDSILIFFLFFFFSEINCSFALLL